MSCHSASGSAGHWVCACRRRHDLLDAEQSGRTPLRFHARCISFRRRCTSVKYKVRIPARRPGRAGVSRVSVRRRTCTTGRCAKEKRNALRDKITPMLPEPGTSRRAHGLWSCRGRLPWPADCGDGGPAAGHVVTADPARRARAAAAHPDAGLPADAESLWADAGELDVVVIATPNRTHVPLPCPLSSPGSRS